MRFSLPQTLISSSQQSMAFSPDDGDTDTDTDVHTVAGAPVRYVPLDQVYSTTSPFSSPSSAAASGSSGVMSKKVKARKVVIAVESRVCSGDDDDCSEAGGGSERKHPQSVAPHSGAKRPPIVNVYSRRRSKKPRAADYDSLVARKGSGTSDDGGSRKKAKTAKGKLGMIGELAKLGVDTEVLSSLDRPRLRDCRNHHSGGKSREKNSRTRPGPKENGIAGKVSSDSAATKRWVRLSFDGADPNSFFGLKCKVYWPLDADWYSGQVVGYCTETNQHKVQYQDGDEENLILSNERIKFNISREDMENLNLSFCPSSEDNDVYDYEEMVVLAASLDDCQEVDAGDIIWAKLTGHAMWPAIVIDESLTVDRKGLSRTAGGKSVPVQFFGTHDFARIRVKQIISFLRGLISSFHLKCKNQHFIRGLEEAKMYLSEQKLPKRMLRLQNGISVDDDEDASVEEDGTESADGCVKDLGIQRLLESLRTSPYVIGDLQIISLGKIVKDSEFFRDDKSIWPEGYTALRKFTSITDPSEFTMYKMEVLRDAESQNRPLFKVTLDSGEQFKGSTPSSCWNKIFKRIKKLQTSISDASLTEEKLETACRSGSYMFGFSNTEVAKLIQELSKSTLASKNSMSKSASKRYRDLTGYRPVRVDWKDLDKCSVCHMDEEYENNLFLQCDKCRIMVHARCYGEVEPVDGVLWLCNLCGSGAPELPPSCCLCPVIGGAMKPTSDGRWAHLACAIWIPETCLSDVKTMQPIDGISRISKDRWKLLCSICGVSYGACIQCSNNSCRVAYHPLCARAAGLCVELEDEDRLHLLSFDEDEENQCIRLLSFCKRHKQPSNDRSLADDRIARTVGLASEFSPPPNPSGCARTEPYDYFGRRGRKEPEALAAASSKRLFVQNQPYLVSGHTQHVFGTNSLPSNGVVGSKFCSSLPRLRLSQLDVPNNILSMAEKYNYMKETFRKRLAFGKSGIHGFGIFAKLPHRAGDMMIEYTGELVRPPIADRRERFIYNSLVGAGTYMFRIDDERVIDATRAGSIAHLINHSCEPNCYSRVISVNGDEHIIIFAKREIKRWEELTYDYRFFSSDEQLACYCGFPRCRGIVNDIEAEERAAKLYAPRKELTQWKGE